MHHSNSQQTWSGFSPTTVPDNNRQSGFSPTTVPKLSKGLFPVFYAKLSNKIEKTKFCFA